MSIVNLSIYKLTKAEESLLEKGLNFIPTPNQEHKAKITQDFLLFERKLRLYHKLHKEQTEEETDSIDDSCEDESPHKLLRPSKGYKLEDHEMEPNILQYKITVLNQMREELKKNRKPRFNTTKAERKAMKTLKSNKDIIIKPADKDGAIVIQKLTDYIKEGERQLENRQHYKKLDNPSKVRKDFIQKVKRTLDWAKSEELIDEDLYKILYREEPRTSNLYLLPNIHKKETPGRPIINSVGSLTETISALVDEILRKYSKLAKSYVKDTTHFLNLIKNYKVEEAWLLCTVDVMVLYTNIPHEEGIEKSIKFLKKYNASDHEILLI